MLARAAGGGAVIAGTVFGKFALAALGLSAFWGGVWAGGLYASSFVLIFLLHWTVATKLPAMTAPALAARLRQADGPAGIEAFVDEVTHLQAQDKYVSIYTPDGEQLIRISLKELADQLDPALFVQVHRSTIVNMRAVETADRDFTGRVLLTLRGVKDKVQVSRQYAHLFARM